MTANITLDPKFAAMGKQELRAACRLAGVKQSPTNDGMRESLTLHYAGQVAAMQKKPAKAERKSVTVTPKGAPSMLSTLFATKPVAQPDPKHVTRVVDGKKQDGTVPAVVKDDPTPRHHAKGYHIQADRPCKNGVKRPSVGTMCEAIWTYYDAHPNIQSKDLPALADAKGWNRQNLSCELYAWRKHNSLTQKQLKAGGK